MSGNKPIYAAARLLALLAIGVASASVHADIILDQRPVSPAVPGNGLSSPIVYDDFSFAAGATITDVHWIGAFGGTSEPSISSFTLKFWTDNTSGAGGFAHQPGAALSTQIYNTNAGQANAGSCIGGQFTCYNYEIDPIASFTADPGTRYWLSIAPVTTAGTWFWATGHPGNSVAIQDFQGARVQRSFDLAYALSGTQGVNGAPEPATIALLGLGLAGLGLSRRRKQR